MRVLWWVSAVLAATLDATRDQALLFLSRCASGPLLETAMSAMDWQHVEAFPWSSAWMVIACVLGHSAAVSSSGLGAWLRRLFFGLLAMVAAMPLACMAGGFVVSLLPPAWPSALHAAAWSLSMLGACAVFMRIAHGVSSSFSAPRHAAPHSSPIH